MDNGDPAEVVASAGVPGLYLPKREKAAAIISGMPIRDIIALRDFAGDLGRELDIPLETTSLFRDDGSSHSQGTAMDVAVRGGSQWRARIARQANYYRDRALVADVVDATRRLSTGHPLIGRVVLELDHFHIDLRRARGRQRPSRIAVLAYGPPKSNALGSDLIGITGRLVFLDQ